MNRRVAYRPRYHQVRTDPRFLTHTRQEYLRHRWAYRAQHMVYPKRVLGSGLALVPWGWQSVRTRDIRMA